MFPRTFELSQPLLLYNISVFFRDSMIEYFSGSVSEHRDGLPGVTSEYLTGKEGINVRGIIKLVEVLTNLIRAVTDLIRELKR